MYDFQKLTLRDMSECGLALRNLGNEANSMEDTSNKIINYLYKHIIDKITGKKSCVLIRFFKTHPYGELTPELQEYVRGMLGSNVVRDTLKCLTLLATAGELPEWNSRDKSMGHKAIPLASSEAIARIPMIFKLVEQLGLNPGAVVQPDPNLINDLEQQMYNVFYVPDALGSPDIPAQTSFVIPFKIRSVVGFGGLLPSGNMFVILMFLKVAIPRMTVDLLRPLALNVKMAILPFDHGSIFSCHGQRLVNENIKTTNQDETLQRLNSQIATLTQLLDVTEQSTITQSDHLEQANADLHKTLNNLLKTQIQLVHEVIRRKHTEKALSKANEDLELRVKQRTTALKETLNELQRTQTQLIQTEKMSSLGQMVAGVAHEINNPVSFIHGNLSYTQQYTENLLKLVQLYQQHYPNSPQEIQKHIEVIDLDFLIQDLTKLLKSMRVGTERIQEIVKSLRNFSRLDEAELKQVDIHEGIDSTLMILEHRLQATKEHPEIKIFKKYGQISYITCYPGQLNQVFMNIITNAIDALQESGVSSPQIRIRTEVVDDKWVVITIADNGLGMNEQVHSKIFDPFFTTKPVGKGTGIGLSVSYQIIVEKHGGQLSCISALGQGAEFVIKIPLKAEMFSEVCNCA